MLRDFLREQAGRRFQLGHHDCGLILADWVCRVTDRDPALTVRGRYHDQESLMRLAGPMGLPRLFGKLLIASGMVSTNCPELGDVAMVEPGDGRPRGAIYTGNSFVTVAEHGLWGIRTDVRLIAAWTFP